MGIEARRPNNVFSEGMSFFADLFAKPPREGELLSRRERRHESRLIHDSLVDHLRKVGVIRAAKNKWTTEIFRSPAHRIPLEEQEKYRIIWSQTSSFDRRSKNNRQWVEVCGTPVEQGVRNKLLYTSTRRSARRGRTRMLKTREELEEMKRFIAPLLSTD